MKIKISKRLLKALNQTELDMGLIRGCLLNLIDKQTVEEVDVPLVSVHIIIHQCLTRIGVPKHNAEEDKYDLDADIQQLFEECDSNDPFIGFQFDINPTTVSRQYRMLAKEVFEAQGNQVDEKLIDMDCELNDNVIQKVLRAHGNLTLLFYAYFLTTYLDTAVGKAAEKYSPYIFLKSVAKYLSENETTHYEFTEKNYDYYIEYFAYLDEFEDSTNDSLLKVLDSLQNEVGDLILGSITKGGELLETLLIQLLGHDNSQVRSAAIKYLNCIYDGTIWRLEAPMTEEVKVTGDEFEIHFTPTVASKSMYLVFNVPNKLGAAITWYKIPNEAEIGVPITLNFGKFARCGFYDFKIVRIRKSQSIETLETKRIIVQNRHIKKANFHEILVDLFHAKKDPSSGALLSSGNIEEVAKSIPYFEEKGVDTLYVSGIHKRADNDPYAIQSRLLIEESIGGEQQFKELLVDGLHGHDMKIIVDLFDRIGSQDMKLKHRQHLTHHLDSARMLQVTHGFDGKSVQSYQNTSIPNYRKKKTWDTLISEAVEFIREYKVDGLHLDNCHLWPSLRRINKPEMHRIDADGDHCYTPLEILNGEVVLENENHVIWTDCTECPNPFLVKLMKTLWRHFDDLIVVGECWQENSEGVVEMSGVVPRSHAFVRNITEDILIESEGKIDFGRFKFNDEFLKDLCPGAILLQSTCLYSSKSPIKTFHKSYLTILDTLFLHEVVPVTMYDEIEGLDSEAEKFIQYFTHNHREMHAVLPQRRFSYDEQPATEAEELELKLIEEEEKQKQQFANLVVDRLRHLRNMRQSKQCLQFGTNVPLWTIDENGPVKTVLSYCRYTKDQVGIIITNFSDTNKSVWVNFSSLKPHMSSENGKPRHETTIVKLEHWDDSIGDEYHLINEFLNCPHQFKVKAHETMMFEVHIQGNIETHPEYYGEARNNFVNTLKMIQNSNHMIASNVYSYYIRHLVESYSTHTNPEYQVKPNEPGENLVEFHNFIAKDPSILKIIESIVSSNSMGPIVFITPELAPWFKIGGLAVMVDELARGFANLGEDTYVIVPYFHRKRDSHEEIILDPKGEYGIEYLFNIKVNLGKTHEEFGVHQGYVNKVKVYFIHHSIIFYEPYPDTDNLAKIKASSWFSKASLQLLCDIKVIPEVVISNDWFTAMCSGYARHEFHFGKTFSNTSFLHIFHNLDVSYEGRMYTSKGETLENYHVLPNEWLIDPYWSDHIINPSRCALLTCDNWASVSKSYRDQIRDGSALSSLLKNFKQPFACSNGVDVKERLKILGKELEKRGLQHMDHFDAKRFLMKKYLNSEELDRELCIFSFVGRITEQKGVDMICSVVEELVHKYDHKIAFIIGGKASVGDTHGDMVIGACEYLIKKFPKNFYADPYAFFYDVPVLSLGSNYCLMPSRFEPGGIVQHEFFIAGTPAVVFGTGGLKDSVTEYNHATGKGNGFEFLYYGREDLIAAIDRAYSAFQSKEVYRRLRRNAFESAIDVADVSKKWCSEVYRIRGKVFIDKNSLLKNFEEEKYTYDDYDSPSKPSKSDKNLDPEDMVEVDFVYKGKSTDRVYVAGSFNGWNDKEYRMSYNHLSKEFHSYIKIHPGTHEYKFKVNGKWLLNNVHKQSTNSEGDTVNVLEVK